MFPKEAKRTIICKGEESRYKLLGRATAFLTVHRINPYECLLQRRWKCAASSAGILSNPTLLPKSVEDHSPKQNPALLAPLYVHSSESSDSNKKAAPQGSTLAPQFPDDSSNDSSYEEVREMMWEGKLVTLPLSLFAKIKPAVEGALRESMRDEASKFCDDGKGKMTFTEGVSRSGSFRTRSLQRTKVTRDTSSSTVVPPGFQDGPSKKVKNSRSTRKLKSTRPFMKHLSTTIKKKTTGTSSSNASVSNAQ